MTEGEIATACAALAVDRAAVVDAAWVDNGPGWQALLLGSAAEVLAVAPPPGPIHLGLVGPYPPGGPLAYEVRAFFGTGPVAAEDPVTGSLNASVAQWMIASERFRPPYAAAQGTALGRAGRIHIDTDDDGAVWVGGHVTTCIAGTARL